MLAAVLAVSASCMADDDDSISRASAAATFNNTYSLERGDWQDLAPIEVDGASLDVTLSTLSGDADLYVRVGARPSRTEYDCRPWIDGLRAESCKGLGPGRVHVSVYGYAASTFEVSMSWDAVGATRTETVTETGTVRNDVWRHFGPYRAITGQFRATLTMDSGDADLYVRRDRRPTDTAFECRPYTPGTATETCTLGAPGTFYVSVKGWDPTTPYELTISYLTRLGPVVEFTSGPAEGSVDSDNTPSFGFTVRSDTTTITMCRVDDGNWYYCRGRGVPLAALRDGEHTFAVRATDADGNQGFATRVWTVDISGP